MAKIYSNARRFSGIDWDAWDAYHLPSGDPPAIFVKSGEKGETNVILSGDSYEPAVTVDLAYYDDWHCWYYRNARTADDAGNIGTVEEIESEQTELFNKIAKAIDTGGDPKRAAAYYGLDLLDIIK